MVLLHAVAGVAPAAVEVVATFDHGTGPASTQAALHVASAAAELGLPVVIGRATPGARPSEAEWRRQRLAFLHDVASRTGATVATAHTRDDQIETVLMRVLRDAGARGLAGLYADSPAVPPLIEVPRAIVASYAASRHISWIDDPSNDSMRFLRNRIRRDLLPALMRVRPRLTEELL